jgi:C-terminal processing protease CtpA/Prc
MTLAEAQQNQVTGNTPRPAPLTRIFKDTDQVPVPVRLQTFRLVWETVRDKYFDPSLAGIDWNVVKTRYEPKLAEATTSKALHDLLDRMVHELPVSHIKVKPPGSTQTFPPGTMAPDTVVLRAGDQGVMIFSVPGGSPAWRAGLRPGHRVLGVGDTTLPDAAAIRQAPLGPLTQATRLLAGPPSSAVRVRVLDEQNRERTVTLNRTLPFKQISHLGRAEVRSTRPTARVGYLWFDWWAIDLADKLEPVLAELGDTDGLVIDLRQNPGGTNPGVNRLARFLLAEPGVVGIHTGRATKPREWRHQGGGASAYRGKVAVLIDEGTGSASEVFAALLQERVRATIIGRTSSGAS